MVEFSNTVTLGDVAAVALVAGGVVANYISVIRTIDGLRARVLSAEKMIEELRRGRGLILEHWPYRVRLCFGFVPEKEK